MTRVCALTLVVLFLGASIPAGADETPSPATIADVRCVIVAWVSDNQAVKTSNAALLGVYFLGRIDAREPSSFDLAQAMLAQINLMSTADLSAEGKRCGKELEGRAEYMVDVGKKLADQKTEQKK
jgi:hypothetical protein